MTVFNVIIFQIFYFIPVMVNQNFQQPLLQSSVSMSPNQCLIICWFGDKKTYQC